MLLSCMYFIAEIVSMHLFAGVSQQIERYHLLKRDTRAHNDDDNDDDCRQKGIICSTGATYTQLMVARTLLSQHY